MNETTSPSRSGNAPPLDATAPADREKQTVPWRRLTGAERLIILLTAILITLTALPRIAPGICFGDPGDLQTACATLGIMHPPGYAGYAAVGHLLCKLLFFIEPPYLVTLACLASVIGSLVILAVLLIRLGLHVFIAAALAAALTLFPHMWLSMTIPEIYGPSLLLLAASVYLLVRYERLGRRGDLYAAAAIFGFLAINRPPALMYIPGFVIALVLIERRLGGQRRRLPRPVGLAAICALAPMLATVALYLALDNPTTRYNYITQYASGEGSIPGANGRVATDAASRWARFRWVITGRQFAGTFGTSPAQAVGKLTWLRQRLVLENPFACALALCMLAIGLARLYRTSAGAGAVTGWVILSVVAYVIVYRIYGQAADLLPLFFAVALAVGAALSAVFPTGSQRFGRAAVVGGVVFAGTVAWTGYHATVRPTRVAEYDARRILTDLDLTAAEPNAAIIGSFDLLRPVWYAVCITQPRDDLSLVTLREHDPIPAWLLQSDRPIYSIEQDRHADWPSASGKTGGKWRLVRRDPTARGIGTERTAPDGELPARQLER